MSALHVLHRLTPEGEHSDWTSWPTVYVRQAQPSGHSVTQICVHTKPSAPSMQKLLMQSRFPWQGAPNSPVAGGTSGTSSGPGSARPSPATSGASRPGRSSGATPSASPTSVSTAGTSMAQRTSNDSAP